MSQPQPCAIAPLLEPEGDQEQRLERLTGLLDEVLLHMILVIGPNATQARVAGRVLRAQQHAHGVMR